jgi:ATP-dependent DNA helicase
MQSSLSTERSTQLIHSLHAILKPFLLRRLKADVEAGLPPKKEYVLYAPLSIRQKELYDAIVKGCLRTFLIGEGTGAQKSPKSVPIVAPAASDDKRHLRPGRKSIGDVDGDDDEWFEHLENGGRREEFSQLKAKQETDEIGRDYQRKATREYSSSLSQHVL